MGADVYVTGDLYFHVAHDAMMLGLNVVDPGHYAEKIMKEGVKTKLESLCTDKNMMCSSLYQNQTQTRFNLCKQKRQSIAALTFFYFFVFTRGNILERGTVRSIFHVDSSSGS